MIKKNYCENCAAPDLYAEKNAYLTQLSVYTANLKEADPNQLHYWELELAAVNLHLQRIEFNLEIATAACTKCTG